MIYFDVTKAGAAGHRSGLMRVSARLADGLGAVATEVRWPTWDRVVRPDDWFFTSELFSEDERAGWTEFIEKCPGRRAAIFHDAIPLKHPQITWPQSVARHPGYMKLLARFDLVWAVSEASRRDLIEFWRWQGVEKMPPVEVIALGADFNAGPRQTSPTPVPGAAVRPPSLLCVGILEPRKNQAFLLEVCAELWSEGLDFELQLVGRVNPHFGGPVLARIKSLRKKYRGLHYHEAGSDEAVARLYATARATVFPTIAEGCGLPLLESLWLGVPCVCSDLPVLRENADAGGCVPVAPGDLTAWKTVLRRILSDDAFHGTLTTEARSRPLPTWGEAARVIRQGLKA